MENISIQFDSILNNEFIKLLLKNDVIIYGRFIREVLIKGVTMEKYSKSDYNVITCYSKYLYTDIIERDIYPFLHGTIDIKQVGLKQNSIVTYDIIVDNLRFVLDMTYVKAIYCNSLQSFENDLNCIIDIDSLCLRRTGISCLEIFGNIPFPLASVLHSINTNSFSFKSSNVVLNYEDSKYIRQLLQKGYINKNCKLYNLNDTDEVDCNICYDKEKGDKTKYVKLACGHIYHHSCISEAISTYFSNPNEEYYECPYCSTKYYQVEII